MSHPRTVIRTEAPDVDRRLAELGVVRAALEEVLRVAAGARNSTTEHDARIAGGSMAWLAGVRTLRDELVPHGFRPVHFFGVELCVHDALGIAIAVISGNAGTGSADRHPTTMNERGTVGRWIAESDQLCFPAPGFGGGAQPPSTCRTWLLLLRHTEERMYSELSLVAAIGSDGAITRWAERIILPPMEFGPVEREEVVEPTPEIEIDIVAR